MILIVIENNRTTYDLLFRIKREIKGTNKNSSNAFGKYYEFSNGRRNPGVSRVKEDGGSYTVNFKDISIKSEYRSLLDNVAQEFYIPLLSCAVKYQRAVGFFSSSILVGISKGIVSLAERGGKIQLFADFMNIGNLFNRNWGLYYNSSYTVQVLKVTGVSTDAAGNATPTYQYDPRTINLSDFYSRWRCQLGARITF